MKERKMERRKKREKGRTEGRKEEGGKSLERLKGQNIKEHVCQNSILDLNLILSDSERFYVQESPR